MNHAAGRVLQRLLIGLVRAYRFWFSPWLGSSCRFVPSCSQYSLDALEGHGALVGTCLTLGRLARCHPGCAGGHDPVPERAPSVFRFLSSDAATRRGTPTSSLPDKTSP